MSALPAGLTRNEVLVIDSKRLRQASLTRLLDSWADATGLTVKAASPDAPLDTGCVPAKCEMIIISIGTASIQNAEHQLLIKSLKTLIPEARLVIISDQEDAKEISAAFHKGAVGFLPTSIEPELALRALSFIRGGGSFFPPFALPGEGSRRPVGGADLTTRQKQVLDFLRQGYSNKAIARMLNISDQTVKVHARRIMRKFGVANRTQLAIVAIQRKVSHSLKGSGEGRVVYLTQTGSKD
jgi:DNA-binding NarL/FixJ family response regulator